MTGGNSPFAIFALPRSRTAWLSRFLTQEPWVCVHDSMTQLASLRDMRELLGMPNTGIIETGMGFAWSVIRRFFPDCRLAVIRRPIKEVEESLWKHEIRFNAGDLEKMDAALDEIAALPGTLSVSFDGLKSQDACRRLSEHCTGSFDALRWREMSEINIQVNIKGRLEFLIANRGRYTSFVNELRSLVAPVEYQAERWTTFYPDVLPLMKAHSEEIGPAHPDMPFDPNLELAEAMDRDGKMGFITARANGRLVGYCVFAIAPSYESKNVLCATQGIFFVLPEFRVLGVGPKLMRAGIEEMKSRGVKMLYLRHGMRGSSPKFGAYFKRIGAVQTGADYSMWLG